VLTAKFLFPGRVYIGLAAFGILAVAGVLVIVGGGSRGGMGGAVELESSTRSHYLGDNTALSTEAARKQAETMFDSDKYASCPPYTRPVYLTTTPPPGAHNNTYTRTYARTLSLALCLSLCLSLSHTHPKKSC
jgi:hypothetical protein